MPAVDIEIHFPLKRIAAEGYAEDELLFNQMGKVNDTPEEEGMPLRAWVIKCAHDALEKNPKIREVYLKPRAVKNSSVQFHVIFDEE
ncbi:hypothetical protein, conserved [Trypanosoma cruzi]|uniref:Uncharacterized protein n=1 Tax=Trypanosoma cruzi (strain CL Brener) TaxID=353153 RepID=Q4DAR1_TRYCC|nr:hypothetical protein, conserved [Trypanosoma cruzi]EAN89612.1 hypothetical protein, conserved [Trypanosoma cruzi]|eukprot:XP_811463.1 hypothetical protein [Trypanosoma cruzi strain CL Brener]